ncbi:MAG: flagellar hook-basal body complex protein FliE [Lachnospiraceae bacterium]
MDISSLYNVSSGAIQEAVSKSAIAKKADGSDGGNMFDAILNSAVDNIKTTDAYISDKENEQIRLAMGETDNTHDLIIATQKASTAMSYTIAVRDKFMEAYKEIMQMQI